MGMSLTAVRAESVAGKDDAEERTMDWTASESSCEGGWDGGGAWKRSGLDLSAFAKRSEAMRLCKVASRIGQEVGREKAALTDLEKLRVDANLGSHSGKSSL